MLIKEDGSLTKKDDTQIGVKKKTRAQLQKIGQKGDTYDSIIERLIAFFRGAK